MTTYVAFLRAVNVGGRNIVKMAALLEQLRTAGLERVSSYLNSGNIIFASPLPEEQVVRVVKDAILSVANLDIDVALRSTDELQSLVDCFEDHHTYVYFFLDPSPEPVEGPGVSICSERHLVVSWCGTASEIAKQAKLVKGKTTSRYPRVVREVLRRALENGRGDSG